MPSESKAKTASALKVLGVIIGGLVVLYIFLSLTTTPYSTVSLAGERLRVDVADDLTERQAGLSGRTELSEDEGMLFVFEQSGRYSFWMKDMLIPIDIIWIDGDKRVVHIEKNISPDSYPTTYSPNTASRYVLETTAGWTERNNLHLGDKVKIDL